MEKTRKSTKLFAAVLSLVMILGTVCVFGTLNAGAATERVSLYSSDITFSKYGITTSEIFVQTKDNASDQQVFIHYNYLNGSEWMDAKADYVTTLSDGGKIWRAVINSFNTEYAIKYVADGEEIWDNNNGKNYTTDDILGVAPVTAQSLGYQYSSYYTVNAVVQNYAYDKDVTVRYTTDGWNSFKDEKLSYSKTNANGTETWTADIDAHFLNRDNFEYAICYKVNGKEFWANNFGANYDINFCIHK